MFVSVKERARQIANGQFSGLPVSAPVASLIDLAPEPIPAPVAPVKKSSSKDVPAKVVSQPETPSKTKSSKTAPVKEPSRKAAPPKATPPPATIPKTTPPETESPIIEASTPKKTSSKTKPTKEPSSKLSSSKLGPPKSTSTSKSISPGKSTSTSKSTSPAKPTCPSKAPSTPKPISRTKPPSPKSTSPTPKQRQRQRSKSPPKRADSPLEAPPPSDPISSLTSACLKQIHSVTGLGGGRRLALTLKQRRSSGLWYAALKDTGSDKYLKMWTNRERAFATQEQALRAYLAFATRVRNEMRWFPAVLSARRE